MQYFAYKAQQDPTYDMIFAIPNGGDRHIAVAKKLRAEGVKAGVLDLCLPVARRGFNGAFFEMKVKPNKLTKQQLEWCDRLVLHGYFAEVCWSGDELIEKVEWYLSTE